MKSKIIYMLLFCGVTAGMPRSAWTVGVGTGGPSSAALAGLDATLRAPSVSVLDAPEQRDLEALEAADPGLGLQRAGDGMYVEDDTWHRHRTIYYGIGAVVVTIVIVAVVILGVGLSRGHV